MGRRYVFGKRSEFIMVVGRQRHAARAPVGLGPFDALAARRHEIPPDVTLADARASQ
jgi:hypothetical protein